MIMTSAGPSQPQSRSRAVRGRPSRRRSNRMRVEGEESDGGGAAASAGLSNVVSTRSCPLVPIDQPAVSPARVVEGSDATPTHSYADAMSGRLVLAATPIGDVGDAPPRLLRELATADVVAAEDTRRLRRLCQALEVEPTGQVLSYHEHNEASRTDDLVQRIARGEAVLLVTDAGMPSVSDPGYRLVTACAEADQTVTCIPGPSAVLMALAVSGLPVDRFCFEGFAPRKAGERARAFGALADEQRTMVFFESPHRLHDTLVAMADAFGAQRRGAVCRELTKTYEEVRRGGLAELAAWAADGVRGEITVVVAGAERGADPDAALAQVLALVADGTRLKDACREVSATSGVPTKQLYAAALDARS
jgi:16S rRNA (cytidine1402-2'-O)-methyltransferase